MSLFAIADLHLSLGEDKPMDVFFGWNDYVQRLEENWRRLVTEDDTVVIAGDISWAMKLEETLTDFRFIDSLPGKKLLLKGNHDYWWSTKRKTDMFLQEHHLDSMQILFNNAYRVGDYAVCGTRGWFLEAGSGSRWRKPKSAAASRWRFCTIRPTTEVSNVPRSWTCCCPTGSKIAITDTSTAKRTSALRGRGTTRASIFV